MENKELTYTKGDILKSPIYRPYIDLLTCLLNDDVAYSEDDICKLINKALKRKEVKVINE